MMRENELWAVFKIITRSGDQEGEIAGFIGKTFDILSNPQFSKISGWASSGLEFVIKDVSKFQQVVLPRYFRHAKMNSFIRQLNMYGFHKARHDSSKCVFSHPLFRRDHPELLPTIKRKLKNKEEGADQIEQKEINEIIVTPNKKRSSQEQTAAKELAETGR